MRSEIVGSPVFEADSPRMENISDSIQKIISYHSCTILVIYNMINLLQIVYNKIQTDELCKLRYKWMNICKQVEEGGQLNGNTLA